MSWRFFVSQFEHHRLSVMSLAHKTNTIQALERKCDARKLLKMTAETREANSRGHDSSGV
eukprot:m.114037 g.114037  ORF g.114037 m.114037 type:complete len:60 (-) comp14152_c0_seq5:1597-1776(-)